MVEKPVAEVRLIGAAIDDLEQLARHDPQLARDALKKLVALSFRPLAGKALGRELATLRSTRFGRGWGRVVWKVDDGDDNPVITVAEVWGMGARGDEAIYDEVKERLARLPANPLTRGLAEVVDALGGRRLDLGSTVTVVERPGDISPTLRRSLFHIVRMRDVEIDELTETEAQAVWDAYVAGLADD